jgi:multisubunit Na+/H+ antiporter MnhE subunit
MTVDVAPDASTIYVHFFHLDDLAAARRSIAELERLVVGAVARRPAPTPAPTLEDR